MVVAASYCGVKVDVKMDRAKYKTEAAKPIEIGKEVHLSSGKLS